MKSYIQPFERNLALLELEALTNEKPIARPFDFHEPFVFRVSTSQTLEKLVENLTYWEFVSPSHSVIGRYTQQVKREATVNIIRNGISPAQLKQMLPLMGKSSQFQIDVSYAMVRIVHMNTEANSFPN